MKTGQKIGLYLEQKRIKRKLIEEATGLSASVVYAITTGKRNVEANEYYRICKALEVPLETFLED